MPEVQPQRIYFDANVFIYAMETDDERGMLARRWVMQIDRREIQAVTSELTLGEVLPHPVAANDRDLAEGYHRLLRNRTTLMVIPVSRSLILEAVNIRAQLKAELPDAIHIATALRTSCAALLTEDTRIRVPPGIRRLALSDARYPL
jgi:predicted nucleic acid-binding protein